MKTTLAILFLSVASAFSAEMLSVAVGWTCNQPEGPSSYIFKVYTNSAPTQAGAGIADSVSGQTNTVLYVERPSDQYVYVVVSDPASNSTNYVADSAPSNIIRIRVLKSGNVKVTQ